MFQFVLIRIYHLFECIEILSDALISHEINSAKTTLAEYRFYNIAIPTASRDAAANRECILYLLHLAPHSNDRASTFQLSIRDIVKDISLFCKLRNKMDRRESIPISKNSYTRYNSWERLH